MTSQMNEIRFDRGKIRTLDEGNRKLFCAADTTELLGYADPQEAVRDCCHWDTKRRVTIKDKEVRVTFVPWNDVKALIRNSKQDNKQEIEDELFRLAFTTQKAKQNNKSDATSDSNCKGVEIFSNESFGRVRVINENGKILFCGSDVARALSYKNPNKAVNDHCRAITKRYSHISGKLQMINYISEGDVYRLIVRSKLPAAEKFEHWLFDEVVPTIRKTGGYMTDALAQKVKADPDELQKFVSAFIKEKDRADELEQKLAEAQPKIYGYNQFLNNEGYTTIRITAKELDVPEKQFTKMLVDKRVLFRTRDGYLLPYANKKNEGMFVVKDFISASGELSHQTLFTTKGKLYVNRIIRENAVAWR